MTVFDALALAFSAAPIAYLLIVAWPLAKTDLREHRLPNKLTLPGLWLALGAQTMASLLLGFGWLSRGKAAEQGDLLWQAFGNQLTALMVGAAVFGVSLAAHIWWRLGMGDVKLLTVMSLSLGWFSPWSPLLALFVGFSVAVVAVMAGIATGRTKLSSSVPLGPYLLAGFVVASALLVYSPGDVIDSTSRALSS
jgi:leader peptidase (prepilin peptidase)/N-methyltransferase